MDGRLVYVLGVLSLGVFSDALADSAALDTVTVTATRIEHAAGEVPAAVDVRAIRHDTLGISLAESLASVPGVLARDRQNFAQETQISIRGFGARATFGIRGVRLYLDGIPATQPDGQGQVSHFNLATASAVEVLRGPFSALYGNSSGGVISLHTADGGAGVGVSAGAAVSGFATRRLDIGSDGTLPGSAAPNYRIGYTHFQTAGSRGHSAAKRDSLQGKLILHPAAVTVTLLANYFDSPDAQDPLGLSASEYAADARQSAPASVQFDTRKSARQTQFGVIVDADSARDSHWRLMAYQGQRSIEQFLAVPVAAQRDARSSGGVVDLQSRFDGAELRWSRGLQLGDWRLTLVAGLTLDALSQQRRGYENFVGNALGVVGALRRDETNKVRGVDQYLQLEWPLTDRWLLLAGARRSSIHFTTADRYMAAGNPDDSGGTDYGATVPVLNLMWRVSHNARFYASFGKGFETPTLVELAYRTDGAAGLNFGLRAAGTSSGELGVRWLPWQAVEVQAALFTATTRDELVVARNSGGRAAFANAARTRRAGAELSLSAALPRHWRWQFGYTGLQAEVVDAYLTCTSTSCVTPATLVAAGNRLPGVPAGSVYQQLRWAPDVGWNASIEARFVGAVYANDLNDTRAAGYTSVDLSGGYSLARGGSRLSVYFRVQNLFDRLYSDSLIVGEANGRYFEPAPGRTLLAGFNVRCCGTSR